MLYLSKAFESLTKKDPKISEIKKFPAFHGFRFEIYSQFEKTETTENLQSLILLVN